MERSGGCEEAPLLPPIHRTAAAAHVGAPWRPRSARIAPPPGEIKWDPYESTMKHDFVYKRATDPNTDCARASKGPVIPFQVDEPTERNIYSDEFCWKPFSKTEPIRTGSSSGIRKNNPQPGEHFLTWQLPREVAPSPWIKPITKQEIEETLKKQYRTAYRRDYLGIQPGVSRDDGPALEDWKMLVPKPPDTESRRHYCPQVHSPDLMDFTWKYGCNAKRHIPVQGAVPSVSYAQIWNHEHTKQLSTYQRDFGKGYLDIVSVLDSLNPEEVKAYVNRAPYTEQPILQNFLDKVGENAKLQRPSSSKKPEENPVKCI